MMSSVMPINQSVSQPIKQSTNQSTKGWKSLQCHWQLFPAEPTESTFYLSQSHRSWQGQSRSQPSTMGLEICSQKFSLKRNCRLLFESG